MIILKITYSNGTITPEEVIKLLALTGQGINIYIDIIKNREVKKKASESGITVSDEELQQFADKFRTIHSLYTAEEMLNFLENSGLTEDDFEEFCESIILTDAIKNYIATEDKIHECLVNNRAEFDLARISCITVNKESLANEIVIQVVEEGEDFHKLARQYSQDEATRYSGGYLGKITSSALSSEVAARVFNAAGGDLLGPFQRDNLFQLILVEEVIRAELNEEVRNVIKERIFNEWMSQFLKNGVTIME